MHPLRRTRTLPRLHYSFLAAPPVCLNPLPSLISSCLNLPFKTPGRSWRLVSVPDRPGTGEGFHTPEPRWVLLCSYPTQGRVAGTKLWMTGHWLGLCHPAKQWACCVPSKGRQRMWADSGWCPHTSTPAGMWGQSLEGGPLCPSVVKAWCSSLPQCLTEPH